MYYWVDYSQIVVCYWLQIALWKLSFETIYWITLIKYSILTTFWLLLDFDLQHIPFFVINIMKCIKRYIVTGFSQTGVHERTTMGLWVDEKLQDFTNV